MIRTVMLDLGNVVLSVDFQRCHAALAKVCSYPVQDIPRRIRSSGLVQEFETGGCSADEFLREVSSILDINVASPQFWDIWSSIFDPVPLIPEAMLEGLHREQKLLLLSNTNSIHFEMIREKYPLLRHFDGYVLSYEVGAMKPSPRIYREAISRAGCQPAECFFTDDVPSFVEGARHEGIDAVQFHSLEQLQQEFRAREIRW